MNEKIDYLCPHCDQYFTYEENEVKLIPDRIWNDIKHVIYCPYCGSEVGVGISCSWEE